MSKPFRIYQLKISGSTSSSPSYHSLCNMFLIMMIKSRQNDQTRKNNRKIYIQFWYTVSVKTHIYFGFCPERKKKKRKEARVNNQIKWGFMQPSPAEVKKHLPLHLHIEDVAHGLPWVQHAPTCDR